MQNNNYIVLMAGGSGTRLWPVSRIAKPKQFHKLTSEKSLLQETYDRVKDLVPKENIYVSLGSNILEETRKQLKDIAKENYIVEPMPKNTAPAIAFITAKIFKKDPSAVIAIMPSDHTIGKISNFHKTCIKAFGFITHNPSYLLTIGIKPDSPHTGYGYIKIGKKFTNLDVNIVDEFVEKPNIDTAQTYLKSGKYLWNAGYYIFRADEIIKMYEKYAPDIYAGLKNILRAIDTPEETRVVKEEFEKFLSSPIDKSLSEKADAIAVIPADLGWSDVGNWTALYELLKTQKDKVVKRGNHIGIDDKNCLFFASDKLLATVGLEDIIVVDTPDVTLVCNKDKAEDIKSLIENIKLENKHSYL